MWCRQPPGTRAGAGERGAGECERGGRDEDPRPPVVGDGQPPTPAAEPEHRDPDREPRRVTQEGHPERGPDPPVPEPCRHQALDRDPQDGRRGEDGRRPSAGKDRAEGRDDRVEAELRRQRPRLGERLGRHLGEPLEEERVADEMDARERPCAGASADGRADREHTDERHPVGRQEPPGSAQRIPARAGSRAGGDGVRPPGADEEEGGQGEEHRHPYIAAGGDDPDPAPPGLAGPEGDVGGQDEEGGQRAQGVEGGDPPLGPRLHICSHGAYYSVASAPRPVRGVPAASPGAHDDEEPHP